MYEYDGGMFPCGKELTMNQKSGVCDAATTSYTGGEGLGRWQSLIQSVRSSSSCS